MTRLAAVAGRRIQTARWFLCRTWQLQNTTVSNPEIGPVRLQSANRHEKVPVKEEKARIYSFCMFVFFFCQLSCAVADPVLARRHGQFHVL
jgi:hypothetical protein